MSKSFNFIEHIADIAAEIKGSTLEELFSAGADAWLSSITDETKFEADDVIELELNSSSREELLITFLNELNYLVITRRWLFAGIQSIKVFDDADGCDLSVELKGIKLTEKMQLKQEIKSVTYHQVEIVERNGEYSTLVVFDI